MELIGQVIEVVSQWQTMGWVAGAIALVNLLTNVTKLKFVAKYIKPSWRPWVAMGLAFAAAFFGSMFTGVGFIGSLVAALVGSMGGGLASVGAHEVLGPLLSKSHGDERKAAEVIKSIVRAGDSDVAERVEKVKALLDEMGKEPDTGKRLSAMADWANKNPPPPAS